MDAQFADTKGAAVDMMRNGSWIAVVEIRWWKICINDESAELIDAAILGVSALPNKLPRSPIAASILGTNQIS